MTSGIGGRKAGAFLPFDSKVWENVELETQQPV